MTGRTLRTVTGTVVIVADVLTFIMNHVVHQTSFELTELWFHVAFMVLGLMLIDPTHLMELAEKAAARIPRIGKGGGGGGE